MEPPMKPMNISHSISRVSLLGWLLLATSWNACTGKPPVSVVIPDSWELKPAAQCEWAKVDGKLVPSNCVWDQGRATIDLGYIRELADLLDACAKKDI